MDWVPNSDPFIDPNLVERFECQDTDPNSPVSPQTLSPECQALQRHDAITNVQHTILSDDAEWDTWISSAVPPGQPPVALRNGYCILFIPRAADFSFSALGPPGVPAQQEASGFTDLPIKLAYWKKVAKAFYLPGHFHKAASRRLLSVISVQRTCDVSSNREKVWMQTATTNPGDGHEYGFALAATHIESRRFTYAVMVGCSNDQISKVRRLVKEWEEGAKHPLMMLGVCAELHLQRVEALVSKRSDEYKALMDELERSRDTNHFHWETIDKVQLVRDKSIRVEEEINTTRSQLFKACSSGVKTLLDQYKVAPDGQTWPSSTAGSQTSPSAASSSQTPPSQTVGSQTSPSAASSSQAPPSPTVGSQTPPSPTGPATVPNTLNKDEAIEVTNLFDERFQDILSRLDGRAAECRIGVERISFSTDVIRSELARQEAELARQEAGTSADNTRYGTAFALMAAVYLPTTAVATIFAMPILGGPTTGGTCAYPR
ncbi:uncharacterized protein LA080_001742 [Diaporthe eres]|uniref:Uncharacterized protein n=1 Tax=Diaporthe vaccinii TaxID=105482 RepID=A0ABR4EGY8_9PEZI|nr:uncharacterized protein LA080_001742 [Diaporthe eres]